MKYLLLGFLLLLSINSFAVEKTYGDVIVSKVESIYDGDTITVSINKWPDIVGDKIEIRVRGIDTAEMHASCIAEKALALKAKAFTISFLITDKRIYLKNMGRDKFFRIDADVIVDGKSLGEELINANLAKPYDGGTKGKWCDPVSNVK